MTAPRRGPSAVISRPGRRQAHLDGSLVEALLPLVRVGFAIVGLVLACVRRLVSKIGIGVSSAGVAAPPMGATKYAPLGRPGQLIELLLVTDPEASSAVQADVYGNNRSVRPTSSSRSLTAWTTMSRWCRSNAPASPSR